MADENKKQEYVWPVELRENKITERTDDYTASVKTIIPLPSRHSVTPSRWSTSPKRLCANVLSIVWIPSSVS